MDDVRREVVGRAAVRECERGLAVLVDGLDPNDVPLCDASGLWKAFDCIERLAANAKVLLAARVEEAGAWKDAGARSAAEHLAKMGGTTTSEARRSLETSKKVAGMFGITDALRGGVFSTAQVNAIASAAAADPSAENRLIALAAATNVTELREECLRTTAAADPDRDATYRRIHARRCLRGFTDGEGARNLAVRGAPDRVCLIEKALEPIIDDLFEQARAGDRHEPREAYAFDALVMLAERGQAPTDERNRRAPKPRYLGLLHLDVEALTRGAIAGEETCEIVGVGPVPVRVARELLGDAILKLVITKGVDVVNVTHLGRGATAAQRIALLWTSPKCANVECSSQFVQIDHRDPWADTHHTRIDELDHLCPHDHQLKTNVGWSLVAGTGRRAFVGPDDPRHPRNKPPP
jgi:Domain of unknown function (DUF222)